MGDILKIFETMGNDILKALQPIIVIAALLFSGFCTVKFFTCGEEFRRKYGYLMLGGLLVLAVTLLGPAIITAVKSYVPATN